MIATRSAFCLPIVNFYWLCTSVRWCQVEVPPFRLILIKFGHGYIWCISAIDTGNYNTSWINGEKKWMATKWHHCTSLAIIYSNLHYKSTLMLLFHLSPLENQYHHFDGAFTYAAHATKTLSDFRFAFKRVFKLSIMIKIVAQPIDVHCNHCATRNEDDNTM